MIRTVIFALLLSCLIANEGSAQFESGWKAHDLKRPAPTVVTPGKTAADAPSDAVVLFDGSDLLKWKGNNGADAKWKIVDGAMESGKGFIFSREEFGDCQLHLEFAAPTVVKGNGQGRGNSGVFLMGEFEIQVLDSFENPTYADGGAGSIYGQFPPLVNASRKPGEWQTYDIIFRRPRFDERGELVKKAVITVLHNGVLIQDGSEAYGPTNWILHKAYDSVKTKTKGPISLQDHGNPVRYRNIWVRPLPESRERPENETVDEEMFSLDRIAMAKYVGKYGKYEVKQEGRALVFVFNRGAQLVMRPSSPTQFSFAQSAGGIKFELDEEGKPTSLTARLDAAGVKTAKRDD